MSRQRSAANKPASPSADPEPAGPHGSGWLLLCALAILALVLVQSLLPVVIVASWDVEPWSELGRAPSTNLGPTATAWINTAIVALSGAAVLVHGLHGGSVLRFASVLALLGLAACIFHMRGGIADLTRGGAWIGAAAGGLAFAHLAQHERVRRWGAAGLVALLVPLALRAAVYVFVEHPMTVEHFHKNPEENLRTRGWEPGSAHAELYLRRMHDTSALGYYGLSNVFGSIVAALTLLSIALTIGLLRRRGVKPALVPAVTSALGLTALALTQSKGAALAFVLGAGLLALAAIAVHWARWRRWLPAAGVAMVVVALLAVLVRGWIGAPGSVQGERSLYFRYQYWGGAARLIAAHPMPRLLIGVGPGAFQEGYTAYKDPRSPEEVTSTHNAMLDWIAMLGVGGLAWSALMLVWLWQAGRGVLRESALPPPAPPPPEIAADAARVDRTTAVLALVLAAAVFVPQYIFQFPIMGLLESRLVWIAGLMGFVTMATVLASPGLMHGAWLAAGLFVALAVLLTQGQIEMTFFHQGAVAAAWLVAALAAGAGADPGADHPARSRSRTMTWAVAGSLLLVAVVAVVLYALPITAHEAALDRAAEHLRRSRLMQALPSADPALRDALAAIPNDPLTRHWGARLHLEAAHGYAAIGDRHGVSESIGKAESYLSPEGIDLLPVMLVRTRAQVDEAAARLLADPARVQAAVRGRRQVVARNPTGLQDHLDLADLLWEAGRHHEARDVYRRVLWLSEQAYLDPARQLAAEDEARVRERLDEAP